MAIAFPRSLRALRQNSFRPTLIILGLAMLLLSLWGLWFFGSRLPLYVTANSWQVQRNGALAAQFDAQTLARLRPGQPAWVKFPANGPTPAQTLTAQVFDVPLSADEPVILYLTGAQALPPNINGTLEVAVEYVSPAVLTLRAAGLLVDTPPLAIKR